MIAFRSLRRRFLVAFSLFGVVLTACYGTLAWELVHLAENVIIERWLAAEVQHVLSQRASDPDYPLPSGVFVQGVVDADKLPPTLRARVTSLPDGVHELRDATEAEWVTQIHTLPDRKRLYLYLDGSTVEFSERLDTPAGAAILGLSLFVALVGVGLGALMAQQVCDPLFRLTQAVSAHKPVDPPPNLRGLVSDDELGVLAEHLEAAMGRVAASARHEQLFGRYTSHELRSSLAVASGVAELLGDLPEPRIQRPIARLERAVQDMQEIIETCLWLARSQGQMPPAEPIELRLLGDELVARLRSRASPAVTVSVEVGPSVVIEAPRQVIWMILNNLLTNALRHTAEGRIVLTGDAHSIAVTDTGPGIPADIRKRITEPYVRGPGDGHGLGLAIVNGLCVRLGWRLSVESAVNEGTTARVRLA